MCNTLISCPLCSVPRFDDLETFRIALIKVATEYLPCPICEEMYMGLDKLTIHLFSHRENIVNKTNASNLKTENENITISDRETSSSNEVENCKEVPLLSKDVQEYKKKKIKHKKVINLGTNEKDINDNKIAQCSPVFNMNAIPFIGIPQNISTDLSNTTAKSPKSVNEKRKNRNDKLSIKCDICGFFFLGKNILEMHKKLIHNVHNSEVVNGVSHYCCHICSKIFKMKGSLMVHLRMVHFAIIPSVNEERSEEINEDAKNEFVVAKEESNCTTPTDKLIEGNQDTAGSKMWKCDVCEKNFTTKYFLKKHKRLHTGEMPYSCTQCNKTFTFQQSYHKHLLYHNDEKPHTCSHCGRGFKELSTLHNHQRIHTGEKPFECETCGKCFRQRVSYLVHRRIHTGAMPYKCTACEKSFRYKVSQRMHKCTAQPPGTVVRQSGDLVQKLLRNKMEANNNNTTVENFTNISQKDNDIQISNDEILGSICDSSFSIGCNVNNFNDKIDVSDEKTCIIDEIVKESISKIDFSDPKPSTSTNYQTEVGNLYAIVMTSPQNDQITNNNSMDDSLPSPSDRLKNLTLNCLSPDVITMENSNSIMKDYDADKQDDMEYMFGIPVTHSVDHYVKDKDLNYMGNNLECHDIFHNR